MKRARLWAEALCALKKTKWLDARLPRRLDHAPRRDAVELLDRAARLIADRGREMDDRVDPAQRVAKRRRVGQVAQRDLHAHALGAQTPRIAHQAAHRLARCREPRQQGRTDEAGRAGQQEHATAIHTVPHYASPSEREPRKYMAYVIAEPCIGTKDNSCVEVCPVDCIHPTPDEPDYDNVEMLYIDPEECIDCDACVEACPVDACFAEDQLPEEWQKYTQLNAEYYASSS